MNRIWTKITALAIGSLLATAAVAQSWPTRPIRFLVGFNPGGPIDLSTRLVGGEMGKLLGTTVVVENRPGANGGIAAMAVVKAEPNGYTLMTAGSATTRLPAFVKDSLVLGKDLSPIGDFSQSPNTVLVRGSLGIKTFQQLVAYAKANPNKLNYGSNSYGNDFLIEHVKLKSGLSFTKIPYKGAPLKELLTGECDFYLGSLGGLASYIEEGRVVPVLVYSRAHAYPNVPTTVELGLMPFPTSVVYGFYGPPGIPREIVQRLSEGLLAATKSPEVIEGLRKLSLDVYYTTPEQQMREYKELAEFYTQAARAANFVPQ